MARSSRTPRRAPALTPEARRVGFVFQDHGLFPHLSVLDNVAFGLRARGVDRATANAQCERVARTRRPREVRSQPALRAERWSVAARRARARPRHRSAGAAARRTSRGRRRVRPARACAARFASISSTFAGVRLIVTHDPLEAASLAERVVVLEEGRVTQEGPFTEVSTRTAVGVDRAHGGLEPARGVVSSGAMLARRRIARSPWRPTSRGPALATIHPRAVALYRPGAGRKPAQRAAVHGRRASIPRATAGGSGSTAPFPLVAEVTPAAAAELRLAEGGEVFAVVKATEIDVYAV